MAYANKKTATLPANQIDVPADRFDCQHQLVSAQIRLAGEDNVFLAYCNHDTLDLQTINVPWEAFCLEFEAMLERLTSRRISSAKPALTAAAVADPHVQCKTATHCEPETKTRVRRSAVPEQNDL